MSMEHEELVKCSICGHEDGFIIWQSLNATLNPEAKADMMGSCLFEHKCPKCGHVDRMIMMESARCSTCWQ